MSRVSASTADYLDRAGAVVTAVPLSMSIWFRTTSLAASQTVLSVGISGTENHRFSLSLNTSGSVRADTRDGSGSDSAFSGSAISINVWCHGLAVFAANNSRIAYANGGSAGNNTANRIPVGVNYTLVGKKADGTQGFVGQYQMPVFWNAALTADDAAALYAGVSPLEIRRAALAQANPWLGYNEADPIGGTVFTVHGTSAGVLEPPAVWNRSRKAYFLPLAAAPALGFNVAPAVSSTTTTAYTVSLTPSGSCTVYGVAVKRGSTAPSLTQVKAGQDSTGAAAVSANSKAITGADTLVLSGLTFPYYDLYFALNSGATNSTVATIAAAFLSPATGKQFVVYSPVATTGYTMADGASPALAAGDVWIAPLATPAGFALTVRPNGEVVYAANGNTARQQISVDVYDLSANALMGATTFTFNNQLPTPTPDAPDFPNGMLFGQAINIDLRLLRPDPEGDTVTVTAVDIPSWASIVSSHLLGTVAGSDEQDFIFLFSDGLDSEQAAYSTNVLLIIASDFSAPQDSGTHTADTTTFFSTAQPRYTMEGELPSGWTFAAGVITYPTSVPGVFGPFIAKSPEADTDEGVSSNEFFIIVIPTASGANPVDNIRFTPRYRSMTFSVH